MFLSESWNRNIAILGYRSEKRRFFSTKTSSETGKAERWSCRACRSERTKVHARRKGNVEMCSSCPKPRKRMDKKLLISPLAYLSCFLFRLSAPTSRKPHTRPVPIRDERRRVRADHEVGLGSLQKSIISSQSRFTSGPLW